ncbi:glycosyltransferase [Sulfobacillus harzensis]|uniref:Glycosyltransferase n=1 Tax=Sulfobacillus harzensis TaxID=2729629 RepID=A0A7Y0L242_9FIRM|nr:glycosyltransferase [Sulfobacillus harzensis]NMP21891.1 glycosyltransferase [Sulfobacillus harzensis]
MMQLVANSPDAPEVQSLELLKRWIPFQTRFGQRAKKPLFGAAPPWVGGAAVAGRRSGTILYAPTHENLVRIRDAHPGVPIVMAESFDLAVKEASEGGGVVALPRLVPESFYPPGAGADTFGVTQRLHLEGRPRLVYLGRYGNGLHLTQVFELTRRLLTMGGEVILWDGLAHREALAPVVKALRLAETIVFAPPLNQAEAAGLLLGADLIWVGDPEPALYVPISWAMASGTPIVARYSKDQEALLGPAALWVYEDELDVWENALLAGLQNAVVREELQYRQLEAANRWRLEQAAPEWIQALGALGGRGMVRKLEVPRPCVIENSDTRRGI